MKIPLDVKTAVRLGVDDARNIFSNEPVSHTPFTVAYRFDDIELRVLFIVHQSADRTRLLPDAVQR